MAGRYTDVKEALELALLILGRDEIGNEYLAMATAGTSEHNELSRKIIREAADTIKAFRVINAGQR